MGELGSNERWDAEGGRITSTAKQEERKGLLSGMRITRVKKNGAGFVGSIAFVEKVEPGDDICCPGLQGG